MDASKPLSIEIDNLSESLYSMKITTNASPMQPLANWEENYKCIWAKHTAGKGGGISKGCFVPVGMGHFDKHLYLRTLEGDIEKTIGSSILSRRKVRIPSIGIGNILKDEGVLKDEEGSSTGISPYVDEVSLQQNPKTLSIREPHNIIVNRGDDLAVQYQLERATRSTPYLDNEAGLLFPSPTLDNPPPNSLIFNVDGKRESAVVGPYVYGDGREELIIPYKEKKGDLRLQLPNGWCLYITEAGTTYLRVKDVDSQTKPSGMVDGPDQDKSVWIKLGADPADEGIEMNSPELISMRAQNDIELKTPQTITLDGGTIVYVGPNANEVQISTGNKTLSHGTHTHQIPPGPAIPGPPVSTSATTDNTIKTKAD